MRKRDQEAAEPGQFPLRVGREHGRLEVIPRPPGDSIRTLSFDPRSALPLMSRVNGFQSG
jgi:hypothetical protein